MIFPLRIMRMVATIIAFLTAGIAGPSTCVAESIGDPWWDEVLPAEADAEAEPRQQAQPAERAQQRVDAHRRQAAMTILRRELSLVRQACPSLSADERSAIVRAGLESIDKAKAPGQGVIIQQQVEGQAGGLQVEVQARERVSDAPQVLVGAAVATAVAKVASAEEAEAYRREIAARVTRRRAAALAILVDAIDQTAMLDAAKRDELAAALEKRWQPFWEQAALLMGQSPNSVAHLPPGVAAVAAEVLSPEAFEAWQARLRREVGSR